jgi:hypothetical protein
VAVRSECSYAARSAPRGRARSDAGGGTLLIVVITPAPKMGLRGMTAMSIRTNGSDNNANHGSSQIWAIFRSAAGLSVDKDDLKRHSDLMHQKLYDLFTISQATARAQRARHRRTVGPPNHQGPAGEHPVQET